MYPSLEHYLSSIDLPKEKPVDSNFEDPEYSSFDEEELDIIGQLLKDQEKKIQYPINHPLVIETIVQEIIDVKEQGSINESESRDLELCKVPYLPPLPTPIAGSIIIQYEDLRNHFSSELEQALEQKDLIKKPTKNALQRAPFDRFRGERRGLSVTDLVSNVWCEKQFEFYLVKGKKKTSPEMTRGHKIHEKLEKEVHETVPVQVLTREDTWGLKLINIIQGLRALKEMGLTRELPVFAFVNGYFIRGIIDEISYIKPEDHTKGIEMIPAAKGSPSGDEAKEGRKSPKKRSRKKKENIPPNTTEKTVIYPKDVKVQSSITDFATTTPEEPINPKIPQAPKTAYLSDCKTRASNTLPTPSQFRAAELQLMLYHFLLSSMFSPTDDSIIPSPIERIATAQKLDPGQPFSDLFISQIADLFEEMDPSSDSTVHRFPNFSDFLSHNSLNGLWKLIQRCFSISVPQLGDTLAVSYRSQANGRVIATKTFEYDKKALDDHLDNVMRWWKGEREALGVTIEEAWKCKSCEFAEECEWRLAKVEELKADQMRKKDEKGKKRRKS